MKLQNRIIILFIIILQQPLTLFASSGVEGAYCNIATQRSQCNTLKLNKKRSICCAYFCEVQCFTALLKWIRENRPAFSLLKIFQPTKQRSKKCTRGQSPCAHFLYLATDKIKAQQFSLMRFMNRVVQESKSVTLILCWENFQCSKRIDSTFSGI